MTEVNQARKTKGIEGMIKTKGYEIGVGKMEDPHIT